MRRHRFPQFQTLSSWRLGVAAFALGFALPLAAQQSSGGTQDKPDEAQSKQEAPSGSASAFIGYATNPSIIFPDIATSAGPLTTGGKFKLFVNQSISPPYVLESAVSAAFDQARDYPRDYGQGWGAYGGRFGYNMASAASSSFLGTFVFASALHQDPRFFPESNPSFWRSLKYSTQRIFVTRKDSGANTFNTSGLLGPLASEGLANVYLPDSERTAGKTLERFGIDLAWRLGGNMFKDYWPTFFRNMGLNKLKVIPDPGKPQTEGGR